jgi:choline dehydrogenase-like flavoprotein
MTARRSGCLRRRRLCGKGRWRGRTRRFRSCTWPGRSVPWLGGRTIGGGSTINGMIYIRGNRLDYDRWRDDFGCAGWGYADILPYFLRAEDGPLWVEPARYVHELSAAWIDAARAAGMRANDNPNRPCQDGAGWRSRSYRPAITLRAAPWLVLKMLGDRMIGFQCPRR